MKDGFLKAAALSPSLRVADCNYNASQIVSQLQDAAARGVRLAVFPEFCLTGYTCGDLFLQRTLQQGALTGLQTLLDASRELDVVALVGLPLLVRGKLYNCAAVLCRGQLLGLVPKTYLPNYGEFYEKRQFTPGSTEVETLTVCGQQVPFGTSLLFRCREMPSFVLGVELCEDLWSALPPSTFHALAGATVIANLSASDETVGKAEYRRALVSNQSARLLCGYLYASAGHGESTQDMVFAGHDLIAENGTILSENAPFDGGCAETEIDCQRMEAERARNTSFELSGEGYQTVEFDLEPTETTLTRWIDPAPFVPGDPKRRAERCELILKMQADGLAKRLEHAHAKTEVFTPTTDPNAAVSEVPAESVPEEVPADSLPEETVPADQPADAEQPADTQTPEPEAPAEGETGGDTPAEAPSISLPTQEEVEQAASSIYNAASSIWGAIQDAASQQNDAA